MSASRASSSAVLLLLLLVLSVCALLSVASAASCTYTLYQDSACAGRPVSDTTTISGLTSSGQCVPSADGVSSQRISYSGGPPSYWNISYAYFQTSNSCDAPVTYRFSTVSNCTMSNVQVASPTSQPLQIYLYVAATCNNTKTHEESDKLHKKNSIVALLGGEW